jgi:hypothetical protein
MIPIFVKLLLLLELFVRRATTITSALSLHSEEIQCGDIGITRIRSSASCLPLVVAPEGRTRTARTPRDNGAYNHVPTREESR